MNLSYGYTIQNNSTFYIKNTWKESTDSWVSMVNNVPQSTPDCQAASPFKLLKFKWTPQGGSQSTYGPGDTSPLTFNNIIYISTGAEGSPCLGTRDGKSVVLLQPNELGKDGSTWTVLNTPSQPSESLAIGPGMNIMLGLNYLGLVWYMSLSLPGESKVLLGTIDLDTIMMSQIIPTTQIFWSNGPSNNPTPNGCFSADPRMSLVGAKVVCQGTNLAYASCLKYTKQPNPGATCSNWNGPFPAVWTATMQQPFNGISDCQNAAPVTPVAPPDNFDCTKSYSWMPSGGCGPQDPKCCFQCKGLTVQDCQNSIVPPKTITIKQVEIIIAVLVGILVIVLLVSRK